MIYLSNDNRRQRRKLLLATLIVIALFGIDILTHGFIRAQVRVVGSAVWRAADGMVRGMTGSGILATRSKLARENEELKHQVAQLEERLAAMRAAEVENEELRAIAHVAALQNGVAAPIISSLKASPYGTFLIGAGASEGVQRGATVLSKEGFVIGEVTEVAVHQALVKELFASRSKLDTRVGTIPITLLGSGGGNAVGEAPRGSQIATGTPVSVPSLGGRLVGLVGKTEGNVSTPSVKVYVRTPVNIETIRFVYVVNVQ